MPALALETGSDATSFTDTDVAANTNYMYRVRAINEAAVGRRSVRVDDNHQRIGGAPALD